MKNLKKLLINPERLMETEELITIRGGYDEDSCGLDCSPSSPEAICVTKCTHCHETAGGWPRPMCD